MVKFARKNCISEVESQQTKYPSFQNILQSDDDFHQNVNQEIKPDTGTSFLWSVKHWSRVGRNQRSLSGLLYVMW